MRLLLAEDDALLADALSAQLAGAGYTVVHAPNGAVADYLLHREHFDLAVLDLGLPMLDGLEVLKRVRLIHPALPVLVLSARDALEDRVSGLQFGADDYVVKPFDLPELLARLQALLRRTQPAGVATRVGGLVLDGANRRATVGGQVIELSGREWALLDLLARHRNQVVGKEQIAQAWAGDGGEPGTGNTIEVYIHRLRRKFEAAGLQIRTVRGLGYLLQAEGA